MNNPLILKNIRENIHVHGILKTMEECIQLKKDSPEYEILRNEIINVGEYPNIQ